MNPSDLLDLSKMDLSDAYGLEYTYDHTRDDDRENELINEILAWRGKETGARVKGFRGYFNESAGIKSNYSICDFHHIMLDNRCKIYFDIAMKIGEDGNYSLLKIYQLRFYDTSNPLKFDFNYSKKIKDTGDEVRVSDYIYDASRTIRNPVIIMLNFYDEHW